MRAAGREHMYEGAGNGVPRVYPDALRPIGLDIIDKQDAARPCAGVVIQLRNHGADVHWKADASARRCVDRADGEVGAQAPDRRDADDVGAAIVDVADVALKLQRLTTIHAVDRDHDGWAVQAGVVAGGDQIAVAVERFELDLCQGPDTSLEVARNNLEGGVMIAIDQRPGTHRGAAAAAGGRRGRRHAIRLLVRHASRRGNGECRRTDRDHCGDNG